MHELENDQGHFIILKSFFPVWYMYMCTSVLNKGMPCFSTLNNVNWTVSSICELRVTFLEVFDCWVETHISESKLTKVSSYINSLSPVTSVKSTPTEPPSKNPSFSSFLSRGGGACL